MIMKINLSEIIFGFLVMGSLLLIVVVLTIYEDGKRKAEEDTFEDLKKIMPKLPRRKK